MNPELRDGLGRAVYLVLGGGGLKGLAHIGAWRALTEAGVELRGMVGTSIGALVGSCLCGGMSWEQLDEIARALQKSDIIRINRRAVWINGIKASSVFRGETLRDYIASVLPLEDWSHLRPSIQMNAVNLETGRTEWFGRGARTDVPLADAIYASTALPVMYPPAELDGGYFVDGGTGQALPVDRAAELGATGVVAVDVGAGPEDDADTIVGQGMIAIHQRIFAIMSGRRRRDRIRSWDGVPLLLIRPSLEGYSTFDFGAVDYFLEEGYRAARRALEGGELRGRAVVAG